MNRSPRRPSPASAGRQHPGPLESCGQCTKDESQALVPARKVPAPTCLAKKGSGHLDSVFGATRRGGRWEHGHGPSKPGLSGDLEVVTCLDVPSPAPEPGLGRWECGGGRKGWRCDPSGLPESTFLGDHQGVNAGAQDSGTLL